MGIHDEADRQVGDLAYFCEQVARRTNCLKRVDDYNAIAANNKSGIATGFAAIGANGRIHAFTNFLDGEVRGVRAKGAGRKAYENQEKSRRSGTHAADSNTNPGYFAPLRNTQNKIVVFWASVAGRALAL
jgi:hypothetical protein